MMLGHVIEHYVLLAGVVFTIGAVGFLVRSNILVQLMSIELMLNAVNLLLVAYNRVHADDMGGQMFAFFVIAVAAAEVAVGLALVLQLYHVHKSLDADVVSEMRG